MSSNLAIVLCVVVLGLTGVVVLLVRELLRRMPASRVYPPASRPGPTHHHGPTGPTSWAPRVDRYGELEDP